MSRPVLPRCSVLSVLPAAACLLGGGLAWAQLRPDAPPEPSLPVAPVSVADPALPSGLTGTRASQSAQPFDQSLDALVRQGVVTEGERAARRGGIPQLSDPEALRRACSSGALSRQECSGRLTLRWGRRPAAGMAADGPDGSGRLGADGQPLPPLTVPVSALLAGDGGSFNLASVFRVTPRPAPLAGNGNRRLLLPILGQAAPSSGFGWRLHPLLGIWRLHAGEDLAAPEGTPVVAALSGRVVSSGLAGGYGLAVEIEHQRPLRRTLYGHLSELYVKAGEWVRQGEVVGRVGSTGLSTGPHLHFEVRVPGDGGWVAMDPGELDPGSALRGNDAIAVLMAQLLASLERPRS
jgi:murein DD-endopeptidase MepM/ murein hydrolase activator NlpD